MCQQQNEQSRDTYYKESHACIRWASESAGHLSSNHLLLSALQLKNHGLVGDVDNFAMKDVCDVFDGTTLRRLALHLKKGDPLQLSVLIAAA